MALLEALDALRRDEPFTGFCDTLAALEGTSAAQHPALQQLAAAKATAAQITIQHIDVAGLTGAAIGNALRSARQHAIAEVLAAR
jgi:tRNA nucleotidyltransferase (CCA-adding enzyme)